MPSEKQIEYALALLRKAGYGDGYMNSRFKDLGATMRQRSGTVRGWLAGMSSAAISELIDNLKDNAGK